MRVISGEFMGFLKARDQIQTRSPNVVKYATTVTSRFVFLWLKLWSYLCPFVSVEDQHVHLNTKLFYFLY